MLHHFGKGCPCTLQKGENPAKISKLYLSLHSKILSNLTPSNTKNYQFTFKVQSIYMLNSLYFENLSIHVLHQSVFPSRFLYVNSRPWPKNYIISDPLRPPPIAQEIDIHVIDLVTMEEVGTMHRAHKAYTPNDECFFIFLDVCAEYVAR